LPVGVVVCICCDNETNSIPRERNVSNPFINLRVTKNWLRARRRSSKNSCVNPARRKGDRNDHTHRIGGI
jgi:hypothetical protein